MRLRSELFAEGWRPIVHDAEHCGDSWHMALATPAAAKSGGPMRRAWHDDAPTGRGRCYVSARVKHFTEGGAR